MNKTSGEPIDGEKIKTFYLACQRGLDNFITSDDHDWAAADSLTVEQCRTLSGLMALAIAQAITEPLAPVKVERI